MPFVIVLLFLKILILNLLTKCKASASLDTSLGGVGRNVSLLELGRVKQLKFDASEYIVKVTPTQLQPHCVQLQCAVVCFNGKSSEITKDINEVLKTNKIDCPVLEELRLYNYEFPKKQISYGFLGNFSGRVAKLYIASSAVTNIAGGSFANGIFRKLCFEDLQLHILRRDFFDGITRDFQLLSIIQKNQALHAITDRFLETVRYQITSLTLQVGWNYISNLTASSNLLNNLIYADFSYNNFTNTFHEDSFSKLSVVESLDLSHSHITYLPNYIFGDIILTLTYLDLSNNLLLTLSSTMFTWREIPQKLKLIADDNPWKCSCELRGEMNLIFDSSLSTNMFCATPEEYYGWSVSDSRLCSEENIVEESTTTMKPYYTGTTLPWISPPMFPTDDGESNGSGGGEITDDDTSKQTTFPELVVSSLTPTKFPTIVEPTSPNDDTILVNCAVAGNKSDMTWQKVLWPPLLFQLRPLPDLRVEVQVEAEHLNYDTYGLIWFSRVTSEYYKMEVNYNEYGLGCYGPLSYRTVVEDLVPDTSYTFCLVLKSELTVSPFSCDSVHVGGNLGIKYSVWLTRDMRGTGISLFILGIVLCTIGGISLVYLTLKHKPTLLKGSKRVAMTKSNSQDIVVFPKDRTFEDFKLKEEMLAKRISKSNNSSIVRRNSVESVISYQSYMNANLYEVIPAYLKLHEVAAMFDKATTQLDSINSYMMPLALSSTATVAREDTVCYATVPPRTKRTSNDPLPEIPDEQPTTPTTTTISIAEIAQTTATTLETATATAATTTSAHTTVSLLTLPLKDFSTSLDQGTKNPMPINLDSHV